MKMDRVPSRPRASLATKATLIIKIEHKFGLFNRFGFNFASVGRHSIKRILFFPSSLCPLCLWVERLVKAEEIDFSVTKDISDRKVLCSDSGHLLLSQLPSAAESCTQIKPLNVSAQNLVAIYIPVAWLEFLNIS